MGMTREQFSLIVKGLRAVYPSENFIKDKDAFNMWYELLKDLDYKQLAIGTTKYMQTNNRVPTPADLRSASIAQENTSEGEAWGVVLKAISRSGYYAQEEFDSLPPLIRKAVGRAENLKEWSQMDTDSMSVIQSQFLNSYRRVLRNERELATMSPRIRELIEGAYKDGKQIYSIPENPADMIGYGYPISTDMGGN